MGPMTGRAAGYCAGYGVPGYVNPGYAWGVGYGRRGGRGRRNRFYATGLTGWQRAAYAYPPYGGVAPYPPPPFAPYGAPYTREEELNALKAQAQDLADSLEGIKKRMVELEGQDREK